MKFIIKCPKKKKYISATSSWKIKKKLKIFQVWDKVFELRVDYLFICDGILCIWYK